MVVARRASGSVRAWRRRFPARPLDAERPPCSGSRARHGPARASRPSCLRPRRGTPGGTRQTTAARRARAGRRAAIESGSAPLEDVAAGLERLGPLGGVAQRHVRDAEDAALLLHGPAVVEHAWRSLERDEVEEAERLGKGATPVPAPMPAPARASRAFAGGRCRPPAAPVSSPHRVERLERTRAGGLEIDVLLAVERHEQVAAALESSRASTSEAAICGLECSSTSLIGLPMT